jgi:hypothetical protein
MLQQKEIWRHVDDDIIREMSRCAMPPPRMMPITSPMTYAVPPSCFDITGDIDRDAADDRDIFHATPPGRCFFSPLAA